MKSLQQELIAKKEELERLLPASFQAGFHQIIRDLKEKETRRNALQPGDWAPDFSLKTPAGQIIDLKSLLRKSPVVVTFYRGSWCPYCTLQLRAFQRQLFQIRGLGGQLVAISPESSESGLATSMVHQLHYPLLHDSEGAVARLFGLLFTMPAYLREVYEKLGVDLLEHNRDDSFALPLPATFVIDQEGRITYAYTEEDFSQRAPIRDVLAALYQSREKSPYFTNIPAVSHVSHLEMESVNR